MHKSKPAFCALTLLSSSPVVAQSEDDGDRDKFVIDLMIAEPDNKPDPIAQQRCAEEAEDARIRGEIIVCGKLGEFTDGSWDKADWQQRYAQKTQGLKPLDMYIDPAPPMVGLTCKTKFGAVPGSQPILIDVEALPEAPQGSHADRIARGLPPLGKDDEAEAEPESGE